MDDSEVLEPVDADFFEAADLEFDETAMLQQIAWI